MPEAEPHRAGQTIAEWRLAGENHDAAQAIACLAGNVVLGVAAVPLHALTSSGEQRLVPLADPRRPPGFKWRRRAHR